MSNTNKKSMGSTSEKQPKAKPLRHLSNGLENLWRTKAQADVIVNIQGKKISCHKAVLMAASPYFEAMFNSGMQEAISGEINFKDVDTSTFELVLEFIYTGQEAASLLQIQQLFKKCEDILSQNLTISACLHIWRFATMHNARKLRTCAFKVILRQFEEFVKQDNFMTLKFDELHEIITDDKLNVSTEELVVKVVLEWGNNSDDNKLDLGNLFVNLRLCQLSSEYLFALKEYFSTRIDNELARKTIDKALKYKHIPAQRQATKSIIADYRDCNEVEDVLVVLGGMKEAPAGDQKVAILEVLAFSCLKSKWYQLAPLPRKCGALFATGSNQENIYITGGITTTCETSHFQYQAASNKWETGAALRQGRYAHAMATMSESLYVFGGITKEGNDKKVLSSIQKYSFGTKKWSDCGSLVQPVAASSLTVTDSKVFVYGGVLQEDVNEQPHLHHRSNLVQYLDISTDVCTLVTLPSFPTVKRAIQIDSHAYLFDKLGNISRFDTLEKIPGIVGSKDIFSKSPSQYYNLVHINGYIYVAFRCWDKSNITEHMAVVDSETWKECKPVLLPYRRTVENITRITIEKKFLTKMK